MSLDAVMRTIDAHADALCAQDKAFATYTEANEGAQRASLEIFECRMKNTFACYHCDINADLTESALNKAMEEVYKINEKVNWLHSLLLMNPEYLRWISKS